MISLVLAILAKTYQSNIGHLHVWVDIETATIIIIILVLLVLSDTFLKTRKVCIKRQP